MVSRFRSLKGQGALVRPHAGDAGVSAAVSAPDKDRPRLGGGAGWWASQPDLYDGGWITSPSPVLTPRVIYGAARMSDETEDIDDDDETTVEENILCLMIELERAFARGRPAWTPRQARAAARVACGLIISLAAIVAEH